MASPPDQIPLEGTPDEATLEALCQNGAGQLVAFVVHCHYDDYNIMRIANVAITLVICAAACLNLILLLYTWGYKALVANSKGRIHLLCASLLPVGLFFQAISWMNPWAISAKTPLIVFGLLGTIGGAMVFQLMMIQKYYYYMVCVALAATVALKPLVDKRKLNVTYYVLVGLSAAAWLATLAFGAFLTPSIDPYSGKSSIDEVQDTKTYLILIMSCVNMTITVILGVQTYRLFAELKKHTQVVHEEFQKDTSRLDRVLKHGRQTVWVCLVVFLMELAGTMLALSALIIRVSEYKQVSWASLWARSATIFSIVTICYIVLLYANRFNRDKVASKPTQESDTSARITTLEPLNTGTNDKKESTVSISSAL